MKPNYKVCEICSELFDDSVYFEFIKIALPKGQKVKTKIRTVNLCNTCGLSLDKYINSKRKRTARANTSTRTRREE